MKHSQVACGWLCGGAESTKRLEEAQKNEKEKWIKDALFASCSSPVGFSRPARPAQRLSKTPGLLFLFFFSFFLLCNGTSQSFGFGREFSKTLQKFPETNPVSGYGRILKCLRAGQKELVSSRSCVSVSLFSSSSFFVSRSRPCAAFTTRRPRWLWRRRSLSRSGSWCRPSGGISICSYFCESGGNGDKRLAWGHNVDSQEVKFSCTQLLPWSSKCMVTDHLLPCRTGTQLHSLYQTAHCPPRRWHHHHCSAAPDIGGEKTHISRQSSTMKTCSRRVWQPLRGDFLLYKTLRKKAQQAQ